MMTVFLRVLADDDKATALLRAVRATDSAREGQRYELDPRDFSNIPRSPFAYWLSSRLRRLFKELPPFESGARTAKQGMATCDDFRFLRAWWEVPPSEVLQRWFPLAKGGSYSPFYAELPLVVAWDQGGTARASRELKAFVATIPGTTHWSRRLASTDLYFRPGITWPLRAARFAPQSLPAGSIFSVRGYCAFVPHEDLAWTLAVFNSSIFDSLFKTTLGRFGFPEFIVGVLQQMPWPSTPSSQIREELTALARQAWLLRRSSHTRSETSHAFAMPVLLQIEGPSLSARATSWWEQVRNVEVELASLQATIDERSFELYGIDESDRLSVAAGFIGDVTESPFSEDVDSSDAEATEEDESADSATDVESLVAELVSWAVGVAFGRFDIRVATCELPLPSEPDPFDAMPAASPAILVGDNILPPTRMPSGYPLALGANGILLEDLGHALDLSTSVRAVLDAAFGADADRWWADAGELLDAKGHDLRAWLARDYFTHHIKQYSRSRRKAPVYWQLGTPSGSYAVWLYAHHTDSDTFFRLQSDFVAPRLSHEERRLDGLRADVESNPTPIRRKDFAASETLVEDLRTMLAEIKRIAPLWMPDLNDGVVITMAPLWRLVPQHPGWQKELKTTWDALCKGDYDWAHVAMHLWPERVVPKCAEDRSLAIAHGLEEHLWVEDFNGRWRKRDAPEKDYEHVLDRFKGVAKTQLLSDIEGFWRTTFAERRRADKQWWVEFEAGSHDDHPLALRLWPSRILHAAWDDESLARAHGLRIPRAADGDGGAEARDRWVAAQLKKRPPALDTLDLGLVASFLSDLDGEAGWAERWARLWKGEFDRTHRIALMVRPAEVVPLAFADIDVARVQGLDRWFWLDDGEEGPRHVEAPDAEVARAIRARHSDAVKAALDDLLSAPITGAARGRGRGRRSKGGS